MGISKQMTNYNGGTKFSYQAICIPRDVQPDDVFRAQSAVQHLVDREVHARHGRSAGCINGET
jgi:hypothetical protein